MITHARFMTWLRIAALVFAATLFAGTAQAGKLRIGHTTWVGYGPLYLARDLGYFKEGGLDVDLRVIEDGSMIMTAVAGGNLDGDASTLDEIMKYRSPETCFKAVLVLDESHGGDGVVTGSKIIALKDLKGQTVAMNEGSTSQFWFSILLTKEGMTPADVKIANMTADDAAAAFIAKRVPAAVTWEPHLSLVKKKKQGKVLVDSASTPGVIVDVVALRCDVIEKHPQDVAALVKGYYRAIAYMKKNQNKAYAIMAKGVGGFLQDPKDFADAAKGVRFFDKPMNIAFLGTPAQPGDAADLIKLGSQVWSQLGKLKMDLDYATLIEPKFASE
ncbi:MAG: ABC transporter substrate-binding protein [Burkholderiales bacterium]|nr:ABC transporter substrate-binding protein [Burkholderiales bacterium]